MGKDKFFLYKLSLDTQKEVCGRLIGMVDGLFGCKIYENSCVSLFAETEGLEGNG